MEKEDSVIVVLIAEASGAGPGRGAQCGAESGERETAGFLEEEAHKFSWFHSETCQGKKLKETVYLLLGM